MPVRAPQPLVQAAAKRLADLLGEAPTRVVSEPGGGDKGLDVVAELPGLVVAVECKPASDVATVTRALHRLPGASAGTLYALAVPYMGDAGRRLCEAAGVGWFDLSGNAHLVASGLRVHIEGKPNLFKRVGRPASVFAPMSARISRWLLQHPHRPVAQQELAEATGMDRGFTSRIVRRLVDAGLVERGADGRVVAAHPDLLLRAWEEKYDWGKHQVYPGIVAARSGPELTARLGEALAQAEVEHAFTGLSAAWQYNHFAAFRLATVYVPGGLSDALRTRLAMREGERGANTWVVVPSDDGVMHGAAEVAGLRCVHPVQAWLDLGRHPERASEARERLRQEQLGWLGG